MSHSSVSDDEHEGGSASPSPDVGMPRWVKGFLIAAAALVLLMVVLMLLTGGQHGPRRHVSSAGKTGTMVETLVQHAAMGDAR